MEVINEDYNRKDKCPHDTIDFIKNILNSINLDTVIVQENEYKGNWNSCRISAEKCKQLSTNGKGINREYAIASGYAEFMERLQGNTEFFLEYSEILDSNRVLDFLKRKTSISVSEKIEKIIHKEQKYGKSMEYYNLFNDKKCILPECIIEKMCLSNGLCAGNTMEEALNQGICEIFERYIRKRIYLGDLKVNNISHIKLKELNSMNLIKAIEENGFICMVKDCTDGGKFPVLAVLIINKEKSRCIFSVGSDTNIDICIQRCITEIFQGRDFDDKFCNQMSDIFRDNIIFDTMGFNNKRKKYQENIVYNLGVCPMEWFEEKDCSENLYEKAFISVTENNESVLKHLIELVRKLDVDIYIRDHSYLGFPTYRVFIPYYSEVMDIGNRLETTDEVDKFVYLMQKIKIENHAELREVCVLIDKLKDILMTRNQGVISTFLNYKLDVDNKTDVNISDDNIFCILVYTFLKDYKEAEQALIKYIITNKSNYNKYKEYYRCLFIYLRGMQNNVDKHKLLKIIKFFCESEQFALLDNIINIDTKISVITKIEIPKHEKNYTVEQLKKVLNHNFRLMNNQSIKNRIRMILNK